MKLTTIFEYDDLVKLQSGVVVEGWRNVMQTGRGKRLFKAEFTEEEQIQVQALYKLFLKWHSGWHGTGIPKRHIMSLATYHLAVRVCNFFGTY